MYPKRGFCVFAGPPVPLGFSVDYLIASKQHGIPNFNNPEESILTALYDRLELKIVTENISERENRLAVLKKTQTGQFGTISSTITLEELEAMQPEVTPKS